MKVVIISSYKYDISHIDDNRAWATVYTLFFPENDQIISVDENTGFGENFLDEHKDWELIKINDEIQSAYNAALEKKRVAKAKADLIRYQKEIDEYNEKLLPQKIGQIVEIKDGRYKGFIGKITWIGQNKFNVQRNKYYKSGLSIKAQVYISAITHKPYSFPGSEHDLICIRPLSTSGVFENGKEKIYIDPSRCIVVHGFEPVELSEDAVYGFNKNYAETVMEKLRGGY